MSGLWDELSRRQEQIPDGTDGVMGMATLVWFTTEFATTAELSLNLALLYSRVKPGDVVIPVPDVQYYKEGNLWILANHRAAFQR